jgi:hypothetical protein
MSVMKTECPLASRTRGGHLAGAAGAFAFALAALLAPAGSASAQTTTDVTSEVCLFGEGNVVCGFVWDDQNNNGIQDPGEPGLDGVTVTATNGTDTFTTTTGTDGVYLFDSQTLTPGTYTVSIDSTTGMPSGTGPSPSNQGTDDAIDSDGHDNGTGQSFVVVEVKDSFSSQKFDFGFYTTKADYPGTGTPGYWKNHSEAWPVSSIVVGGRTYTKAQAIAILSKPGKDKANTMFSSLVPAKLNVLIGNPSSCIDSTIVAADAWMATYPAGSNISGGSAAWRDGEPLHTLMDAYNNGLLCAPHRN